MFTVAKKFTACLLSVILAIALMPLFPYARADAYGLGIARSATTLDLSSSRVIPLDWTGEYDGSSGWTTVRRDIEIHLDGVDDDGSVDGTATISPSDKAAASYGANGTYRIGGTIDVESGDIRLQGYEWIDYPVGYSNFTFIELRGTIDELDGSISGTTSNGIWEMVSVDYSPSAFADSGFTRGRDSNSFAHSSSSFNNDRLVELDEKYYDVLTDGASESEKSKIKVSLWNRFCSLFGSQWHGVCYGIAATMGMLYENILEASQLTTTDAKTYYEMGSPGADSRFKNAIYYYYLTQMLDNYSLKSVSSSWVANSSAFSGLSNWDVDGDSQTVFLRNLVRYAASGKTGIFAFMYSGGGHAILITGCSYDAANRQYRIKLYDENSTPGLGKHGNDSYLLVSKDYSSFTYTDANDEHAGTGPTIQTNDFKSMYLVDYDSMKPLSRTLSTSAVNTKNHLNSLSYNDRVEIELPSTSDFVIENGNGQSIVCENGVYSGDMPIHDIYPVASNADSRIAFVTDSSDSYVVSGIGDAAAVSIRDSDDYQAYTGEGVESAIFDLDGAMRLTGDDMRFDAFMSTDELVGDSEKSLLEISASTGSDVSFSVAGDDLVVESDGLRDAKAYSMIGNELYSKDLGTVGSEYVFNSTDLMSSESPENSSVIPPASSIDINQCSVILDYYRATYTGSAIEPRVVVTYGTETLVPGADYAASYSDNVNAGTGKVLVEGKGRYEGSTSCEFAIAKASNALSVKTRAKVFKVKAKKKKRVIKSPLVVRKSSTPVTFNNASSKKKLKKFKVNKSTGAITVPKNLKKGTYKVKVKAVASTSSNFESATKKAVVKVRII